MKIGEITDLILSEAAPYFDEAIADAFIEIENESQSYAEAKEKKEGFVSQLGKVAKGAAIIGGGGYLAHKAGMRYDPKGYGSGLGKDISAIGQRGLGALERGEKYIGTQAKRVQKAYDMGKIERNYLAGKKKGEVKKYRKEGAKEAADAAKAKAKEAADALEKTHGTAGMTPAQFRAQKRNI
jgi:hypothetical protein